MKTNRIEYPPLVLSSFTGKGHETEMESQIERGTIIEKTNLTMSKNVVKIWEKLSKKCLIEEYAFSNLCSLIVSQRLESA